MSELEFWNATPWIEAASILIAADEPLRALELLDNVPSYYRDHIPMALLKMKQEVLAKISTVTTYLQEDDFQLPEPVNCLEGAKDLLRFQLISKDVEALNSIEITPHIFDLGPGSYWLPICLNQMNMKFTYSDVGLNKGCQSKIKSLLGDGYRDKKPTNVPVIFVACEIIEHLHFENDILAECLRHGVSPDIIHISTPRYTFDNRKERLEWTRFGDLGHLRAYTPTEFMNKISNMFPFHSFKFYDSKILHARGGKK